MKFRANKFKYLILPLIDPENKKNHKDKFNKYLTIILNLNNN